MNFTTQLKTWAAGIGLAASIMNFTPINAQGVDRFDTIALDAPGITHINDSAVKTLRTIPFGVQNSVNYPK